VSGKVPARKVEEQESGGQNNRRSGETLRTRGGSTSAMRGDGPSTVAAAAVGGRRTVSCYK